MIWRSGRHTPTKNSQEYPPRDYTVYIWVGTKTVEVKVLSKLQVRWRVIYLGGKDVETLRRKNLSCFKSLLVCEI